VHAEFGPPARYGNFCSELKKQPSFHAVPHHAGAQKVRAGIEQFLNRIFYLRRVFCRPAAAASSSQLGKEVSSSFPIDTQISFYLGFDRTMGSGPAACPCEMKFQHESRGDQKADSTTRSCHCETTWPGGTWRAPWREIHVAAKRFPGRVAAGEILVQSEEVAAKQVSGSATFSS
jgi:hypothetical protein